MENREFTTCPGQGYQDFYCFEFEYQTHKRPVYQLGNNALPAVIIIQELPGLTKQTIALARRLHEDGYRVLLPVLLGKIGSAYEPMRNATRICINKTFRRMALGEENEVINWLRALSIYLKEQNDNKPIGAIGMCMSGGFVLSLLMDDAVCAPVMCQPASLLGTVSKKHRSGLGIPAHHLEQAIAKSESKDIPILGLRFTGDVLCPGERFNKMEDLFGERFIRLDIDSSLFNKHQIPVWAHAVLTIDYNDKPGHPTRMAYEKLLGFFEQQLMG